MKEEEDSVLIYHTKRIVREKEVTGGLYLKYIDSTYSIGFVKHVSDEFKTSVIKTREDSWDWLQERKKSMIGEFEFNWFNDTDVKLFTGDNSKALVPGSRIVCSSYIEMFIKSVVDMNTILASCNRIDINKEIELRNSVHTN